MIKSGLTRLGNGGLRRYNDSGSTPVFSFNSANGMMPDGMSNGRLTGARMYDSTGMLVWGPENLLRYSEDLTPAPWTTANANIISATTFQEDASTSVSHRVQQSTTQTFVQGEYWRVSADVWSPTGDRQVSIALTATFFGGAGDNLNFDPVNGVVISQGANVINVTTQMISPQKWRVSYSVPVTATNTGSCSVVICAAPIGNTSRVPAYTGNGSSQLAVSRISFYRSRSSEIYLKTVASTVYGVRIDYDPSTLLLNGLLSEEQRSNLLNWSQDLSQSTWFKTSATITPNAITAPDGTNTFDRIDENGVAQLYGDASGITAGNNVCASFYAKRGNHDWIRVGLRDTADITTGINAWFNLATGAKGSLTINGGTPTELYSDIQPLPNGVYRITVSCILNSTATGARLYTFSSSADAAATRANIGSGEGVGTQRYQWGHQLEQGQRPSSYIYTDAATSTRGVDIITIPAVRDLNQATFYINAKGGRNYNESGAQRNRGCYITGNAVGAILGNNGSLTNVESWNGTASITAPLLGGRTTDTDFQKIAVSYDNNGPRSIVVNGGTVNTQATFTGTYNTANGLLLGTRNPSGGYNINGWYKDISIFRTNKSEAEIKQITQSQLLTVFGDSIARGTASSDITKYRWTRIVADRLGMTEDNKALGGSTLSKRSPVDPFGSQNMVDRVAEIPQYDPVVNGLLLFAYGMNDWGTAAANYTPTAFVQDYRTVLNYAITQRGWPRGRIVLVTPSYPTDAAFSFYSGINGGNTPTRANILLFVQATVNVATEYSVKVVNMYNPMASTSNIASYINTDGVHPLNSGHLLMSQIWNI